MTQLDKINYIIQSLHVAKDEIEYARVYYLRKNTDKDFDRDFCNGFGATHRIPNGTTIRDALHMVRCLANQVANECTLTPYCEEIFKD